ncbi:MAG: nuclear transport factor 2 family protein [Alphaproteobacteria bacterium]
MDKLARLVARAEIEDALCRYSRGVDRRDWPAVKACYHDDAFDQHGDYSGDVDGFIAWVSVRHAHVPFSAHFLGNCLIEFVDDTTAIVETYFHAMRRNPARPKAAGAAPSAGAEGTDVDMIGRYLDRFELRNGNWRIAKRMVVSDAARARSCPNVDMKGASSVGTRDRSDPLYAWRAEAGL